ncbi:GntR family transcriptional regulator [Xanthobacter sp. KR7-65]|uniref:GntR family transcriptional regulator n=1 Tax=Xanthobacter sp. KR7-65 TaxID=3156612 RepID=UPI0032B4FAD0
MSDSKAHPADTETVGTLSQTAYQLIRRDILSGVLEPGAKLKIETLRAAYQVGPTPIREALSRLSAEELVQIEQQRGFRVAPVTIKELQDISDVRIMLESEAVRRSILEGDYAWEANVVSAFHKLDRMEAARRAHGAVDFDEWEARNREFHDALVAASGSKWLNNLGRQLYSHHERYRRAALKQEHAAPQRDVHAEHRALMEASLARNVPAALDMVRLHIERTVEAVRASLAAAPRRDARQRTPA